MTHPRHSSHHQPTLSGKTILPDVLNVTYKRARFVPKQSFPYSRLFSCHCKKSTKKNNKPCPGKTSMATPSFGSGDQSSKGRQNRDSQPLFITAKHKCGCRCLGRCWTFGSELPPFVSQSTSLLLGLSTCRLRRDHTHAQVSRPDPIAHQTKLPDRKMRKSFQPNEFSLRTTAMVPLQKEMGNSKAVSSK